MTIRTRLDRLERRLVAEKAAEEEEERVVIYLPDNGRDRERGPRRSCSGNAVVVIYDPAVNSEPWLEGRREAASATAEA